MNKLILALLCISTLSACDLTRDKEELGACDTPTTFAPEEIANSIKVNFIGSTIGACAGTEIPLVVSGTYGYNSRIDFNFTTNPADTSIKRYRKYYDRCWDYNTLDCSNFVFTVQDETTGISVGEVTPSCNLKLHSNVGHRTVVKARNKQSSAFWPDSTGTTTTQTNVLTCN